MLKDLKNRLFGEEMRNEVADMVETKTPAAPITMYTTRFCPYCMRARALFESKGVEYTDIPVDGNPALRQEMMEKAGRHTVPQIWIGEEHIGGCDELYQLERHGELDSRILSE